MPLTLSIADNADGTGGVATIAGADAATVTLHLQQPGGAWNSAGTRTGSGDIEFTSDPGYYFAYAAGTVSGSPGLSRIIGLFAITEGAEAVHQKIKSAIAAQIKAIAETSFPLIISRSTGLPNVIEDLPLSVSLKSPQVAFPGIFVAPYGSESKLGSNNNRDLWGKAVQVIFADRDQENYQSLSPTFLKYRQTLIRHFHHKRLTGVSQVDVLDVEPFVIFDPKLPEYHYMQTSFVVRAKTRESRVP